MTTLECKWKFRERVWLDGDGSIEGTILGLLFREGCHPQVEVSWIHNGDVKSAWFDEWRLRPVT